MEQGLRSIHKHFLSAPDSLETLMLYRGHNLVFMDPGPTKKQVIEVQALITWKRVADYTGSNSQVKINLTEREGCVTSKA